MSEKDESRRISRRRFLRGFTLAGGGALLAACRPKVVEKEVKVKETVVQEKIVTATPAPKGKVTIKATSYHTLAYVDPLAYDLGKERIPDINLIIDQTPRGDGWNDFADNIMTRIAGGEGLDVIYMASEGMPLLAEKKVILPLDPFLEKADAATKKDLEEDFHPVWWKVFTWKGKRMIHPLGGNNMIMYFNPKIFKSLGVKEPWDGWSFADFLQICLQVAQVKGTKDDRYAVSWTDDAFGIAPWYFNFDTSWLKNDDMESNLDDPKVAEVLQFMVDLIQKHKVSPQPAGWDERGQFHSGHLAMRGCGRWCVGQAASDKFTDWNFQYFPHKAGPLRTVVGAGGWGIATMSKYPEECWRVLNLLNCREIQLKFINTVGSICSRRSVVASPDFQAAPPGVDMGLFYKSLDYGKVVPAPPNFNVVDPLMRRWYGKLWNGDITVSAMLAGAHKELQAEMAKLQKKK